MSSTSSITDVAALARVSEATVSRVLSGRRTKDDNIAKRVRDAAEQLNYQANSAASALRSDTTNTIGLIMPGPTDPLAARWWSCRRKTPTPQRSWMTTSA